MVQINLHNEKLPQFIINGSFSYCSQIHRIPNDTLRNNILFHSPNEEKKFNCLIDYCELRQDLATLIGGDMTEIGEKGINFSGLQKAR
jgi:ABC-type transport system involved in cytochrome bd biosynthesis fused ATPase/permease subunit